MKRGALLGGALAAAAMLFSAGSAPAQTAGSPVNVWLVNPYGDVDGVLLRDGRAFYFPTEVGRMLTGSVRIGDVVHVDVVRGRRLLVDQRDGSSFDMTAVARGGGPVGIPALQRMTARGTVTAVTRMTGGVITGFVLGSGEQVRVPPSATARLGNVRVGDTIVAEGLGNRGRWGIGLQALAIYDGQGRPLLRR
jgi:hypothetical protein